MQPGNKTTKFGKYIPLLKGRNAVLGQFVGLGQYTQYGRGFTLHRFATNIVAVTQNFHGILNILGANLCNKSA